MIVAGQAVLRPAAILPPLPAVQGAAWHGQVVRAFRSGSAALLLHKWRAALTMVSVLLGIAGVLIIDSVGHSQRDALAARLATLGTNLIAVQPGAATVRGVSAGSASRRTLLDRDSAAIRAQVPHIARLTAQDSGWMPISAGHSISRTMVSGVDPDYRAIQSLGVDQGTFFAERDNQARARVAVIGPTVVQHVFPGRSPVGQHLRLRSVDFTVIGVLTARGRNAQVDLDDIVLVPFSTGAQYLFGPNALAGILVQADDQDSIPAVMAGLKRALEASHDLPPGRTDDFQLTNFQQLIDVAQQQSATLNRALTYVAAVTLAIGALGIMNILLLSVTERTMEIGVMMAVGAQRRDVLLQFLTEALTLSVGGGLAGMILGFGLAAIVPRLVTSLAGYPELPSLGAVGMSCGVSLGIGVLAGLYPAAQAAWMDPVDALRAD